MVEGREILFPRHCCQYPSPVKRSGKLPYLIKGIRPQPKQIVLSSSNFQLLAFFFLLLMLCSFVQSKFYVNQNNCPCNINAMMALTSYPPPQKVNHRQSSADHRHRYYWRKVEFFSSACITPVEFATNTAISNVKCSGKLLDNYY